MRGRPTFEVWLPPDVARLHELRVRLGDYLATLQLSDRAASEVVLSVQEAAKNAIRFSSGRTLHIQARMDDDELEIVVSDQGPGFVLLPKAARPDVWQVGGRGLFLMQSLMDTVCVDSLNGARVLMTKRLADAQRRSAA